MQFAEITAEGRGFEVGVAGDEQVAEEGFFCLVDEDQKCLRDHDDLQNLSRRNRKNAR